MSERQPWPEIFAGFDKARREYGQPRRANNPQRVVIVGPAVGRMRRPRSEPASVPRRAGPGRVFHLPLHGIEVELVTIGELARVLNRDPQTIRRWIRGGVFPRARYTKPSADRRGRRALWTRKQVERIEKAAWEEGVLPGPWRRTPIPRAFTEKAFAAMQNPPPSAAEAGPTSRTENGEPD